MNPRRAGGGLALGLGCLLLASSSGLAQESASTPAQVQESAPPKAAAPSPAATGTRPRLALVLSGGGARGAAHVGVLKVLEELHVRPDFIVGTSMGSVVGGLYAAGYSPEQLEKIIDETDWKDIFIDTVDRRDRSFRRKQDDATFLVPGKLRFKGFKPYIPPSLLGGQQLELLLRSLEIESNAREDFDQMPIPYRAVALDLESGQAVILDHGSLATAIRASMAVPGVFSPVELDGRSLVDGGAVANLPIGIAQSLGAESIIAVDITSPPLSKEAMKSFFAVMSQWSGLATIANRSEDIKKLHPGDVLITPNLGDISFMDFTRTPVAIGLGEKAAREAAGDLRRFAVSDAEWEAFQGRHKKPTPDQRIVDEVRFKNTSWVADGIIAPRLRVPTGQPFDAKIFDDMVMKLYGLDYFGVIRQRYEQQEGKGVVSLDIPRKPYGKNSLQFGASLRDDFSGDANYTLSLRHLLIAANRRGGEWENVAQMGQTGLYFTSFYQPLDYKMRWFVAPSAETRRDSVFLWENGEPSSEVKVRTNSGDLEFGRVLGDSWEAKIGAFYAYSTVTPIIGSPPPEIGEDNEHDSGVQVTARADSRDSSVFPQKGMQINAWFRDSLESMGADADREMWHLDADIAMTFGRVTLVPAFSGQTIVSGPVSFISSCALGGFLNLSGLGYGELRGERCLLARGVAYVQLSHIDLGPLSSSVYGGLSVEGGNVYFRDDPVNWDSLILGGSVFVGAKTPIGPAFVAWGSTDNGEHRFYFVIGARF